MAAPKGLQWLVKVNDFLEEVPKGVLKYFKSLIKSAEEMTQAQVDIACTWMAWQVNKRVEGVRQRVVRTLYNQYGSTLALMKVVTVVQNVVKDPIGSIGSFVGVFSKPVGIVIAWATTLMVEIPRLARNLSDIATMQPPAPPNPNINFHAFSSNLKINTITMSDIINGPNGMTSPEVMFPEPPKPFGKGSFDASFLRQEEDELKEEAKELKSKKKNKIVYKLSEKYSDSTSLEDLLREATFTDTNFEL